jgi:hypothetical protein
MLTGDKVRIVKDISDPSGVLAKEGNVVTIKYRDIGDPWDYGVAHEGTHKSFGVLKEEIELC